MASSWQQCIKSLQLQAAGGALYVVTCLCDTGQGTGRVTVLRHVPLFHDHSCGTPVDYEGPRLPVYSAVPASLLVSLLPLGRCSKPSYTLPYSMCHARTGNCHWWAAVWAECAALSGLYVRHTAADVLQLLLERTRNNIGQLY